MQQNVDGFERYFAQLTPSQRLVYGWLGLFNIYHSWYFNALLGVLSLNIVLATIDRFPKTWLFAARPHLTVPLRWLRDQSATATATMHGDPADITGRISKAMIAAGGRKRSLAKNGKTLFSPNRAYGTVSATFCRTSHF